MFDGRQCRVQHTYSICNLSLKSQLPACCPFSGTCACIFVGILYVCALNNGNVRVPSLSLSGKIIFFLLLLSPHLITKQTYTRHQNWKLTLLLCFEIALDYHFKYQTEYLVSCRRSICRTRWKISHHSRRHKKKKKSQPNLKWHFRKKK